MSSCSKIPVVNLGQLGLRRETEPSQQEWQRVAEQLLQAFTNIGCAYIINHGVPDDQLESVFSSGSEFFRLDQNVKNKYAKDLNTHEGYIASGKERFAELQELHETYNIKSPEAVFPDAEVPSFRPSIASLFKSCRTLSIRLMKAVALSLGKEMDYFVSMHQQVGTKNNVPCLRVNYYPPVPATVLENATRFSAHTDYTTFTFIFQDDMGGLQIRDQDGTWLDAGSMPGAILILAGEFLTNYSDNKVIAPVHRVVIPAEELKRKTHRLSVAYFTHADGHTPMRPQGTSKEKPTTVLEYASSRLTMAYK
ncbi:uncharacterized protein [Procambarus clarkii]|uniref:uncharacterized protein n=1 Tax=Procambarus clarkii TaxID=6728 RepID=UPI003743E73B